MTFPAWFELHRDRTMRRHPAAMTIYASLLTLDRILYEPRTVKAWVLAEAEGLEKETVLCAMNLLVERGYLLEHERGPNNVRRFTVATTRASGSTPNPTDLSGSPQRREAS